MSVRVPTALTFFICVFLFQPVRYHLGIPRVICTNIKILYILLTVCVYVFQLMLRMNTDFVLHISRLVLIMENPCVS